MTVLEHGFDMVAARVRTVKASEGTPSFRTFYHHQVDVGVVTRSRIIVEIFLGSLFSLLVLHINEEDTTPIY